MIAPLRVVLTLAYINVSGIACRVLLISIIPSIPGA